VEGSRNTNDRSQERSSTGIWAQKRPFWKKNYCRPCESAGDIPCFKACLYQFHQCGPWGPFWGVFFLFCFLQGGFSYCHCAKGAVSPGGNTLSVGSPPVGLAREGPRLGLYNWAGLAVRRSNKNRNRNSHSRYSGEPGLNAEELLIKRGSSTTLALATRRCRIDFSSYLWGDFFSSLSSSLPKMNSDSDSVSRCEARRYGDLRHQNGVLPCDHLHSSKNKISNDKCNGQINIFTLQGWFIIGGQA
jgi:hypothetical protein